MTSHLKKASLSLALALAFLLSACGKDDSSASASATSLPEDPSASTSAASGSEASDPSAVSGSGDSSAAASAAPALPVVDQLPLGTFAYLDTEGLFPDERAPQLELLADNRATFRVNTGNEVGMVAGSVTFQGSDLALYIESSDIETAFWGGNASSLTFRVLDADRLEYTGGPFGLTQRQMVFARQPGTASGVLAQGSGTAPAPVETDPAAAPQSAGQAVSGSTPAPSGASDTSGDGSDAASEPEEDTKVPVIEPDKAPPETLKKGESIRLVGMDLESLVYDAAYFDAAPGADGASVTLTALLEGDTALAYATAEGEFAGQVRQFSVSIVERGVRLWLVIAIAAAAAVVGGAGAIVTFLTLKKRRDNKEERLAAAAEKKEQRAAAAEQKREEKEERAQEKQAEKAEADTRRQAQKARKEEQAAAKQAKTKDKKARAAAKKAANAAQEAEKAAEKVSAAAEKHSSLSGKKVDRPKDAPGDDEG